MALEVINLGFWYTLWFERKFGIPAQLPPRPISLAFWVWNKSKYIYIYIYIYSTIFYAASSVVVMRSSSLLRFIFEDYILWKVLEPNVEKPNVRKRDWPSNLAITANNTVFLFIFKKLEILVRAWGGPPTSIKLYTFLLSAPSTAVHLTFIKLS